MQSSFFSLPDDNRKQLNRAYMELVCYEPWKESPEESFLDKTQCALLHDAEQDPDSGHKYSLQCLEMFWQVYRSQRDSGKVAPCGSQWKRDNQYSYSMYLTTKHNVDVMQPLEQDGTLSARYEADEKVRDTGIDLHLNVHEEVDPNVLTHLY